MKKLSVIIPAYNSEETIKACVESVLNECISLKIDFEIIIIDDGSTDITPTIISNLIQDNQNIIYIKQKNSGPSAARNKGLSLASGEFIALNDSDDIWISGTLKNKLEYLQSNPDIDLITCQYSRPSKFSTEKIITFKDMAFHNYFATQTVLFRNSFKRLTFPENMKYSEDMRFFLTAMLEHKCFYSPEITAKNFHDKISFGDSGLSSHLGKMEKGELSNIVFIYKNKKISFIIFIFAILFSIVKFLRRCLITFIRKLFHNKRK